MGYCFIEQIYMYFWNLLLVKITMQGDSLGGSFLCSNASLSDYD